MAAGWGGGRIGLYLTPAGDPIQGKGISPDLEVDEPEAADFVPTTAPPKDVVLDAAIDRIRGKRAA